MPAVSGLAIIFEPRSRPALLGRPAPWSTRCLRPGAPHPKVEIEQVNDWEARVHAYCNEFPRG